MKVPDDILRDIIDARQATVAVDAAPDATHRRAAGWARHLAELATARVADWIRNGDAEDQAAWQAEIKRRIAAAKETDRG